MLGRKKVLMSVLVAWGMVSFAQAEINLTLTGCPAPDTIYLQPSDWIELGVFVSESQLLGAGDMAIRLSQSSGYLDWENVTFINPVPTDLSDIEPGLIIEMEWTACWEVIEAFSDPYEMYISGGNASLNAIGPFDLVNGLMFHCDEPINLTIELVAMGGGIVEFYAGGLPELIYVGGEVIDSIYVVQPEPSTLALLALGGVALTGKARKVRKVRKV